MRLLKMVPDDTNIHFLKWRLPFFIVSALLIAASWALVLTQGFNFGVDFAGGVEIQATFTQSKQAPVAELRKEVRSLGFGDPVIQRFGADNQVSIRMSLPKNIKGDDAADKMADQVVNSLRAKFPDFHRDYKGSVSGKVSSELFSKGLYSLLFAMIAISIYIWVRFEWQFGVGALLALFHDVSLTLGMFALTQMEFDLNIVAAILTIIGYSLNDTIVVYDRIRENLKKYRKMPLPELLDLSVNETLARTVMTSATMLIALIPLLLFGPPSLFGLTAAITLGIFVGTYSSIYMAAPLLVWFGVTSHSFVPTETAAERQDRIARGEA
ncbi:protein translocase subunit SecF [Porphyrobacter algicida]|uniref:Protein-export membrane protein SecF n=1 Tax=Qipengyuania algicida TaxID=1836209 RepID=A0A845AD94_9SPHN|nr:protein translocase subunit SecF [Qipengyuania algicida]MXP27359.1 protein translocase subunit SecF [Qipengyuania algicida]